MDQKDKELLNNIQNGFPIDSRPFLRLAEQLHISENEVIDRIDRLKQDGYIRRVGGIFDSRKLGYYSTLCAMKVPKEKIKSVAEIVNQYENVTHNYIREHSYNMWFTMIASSTEKIEQYLNEIKTKTGIEDIMKLPSVKFFKINVVFDMRRV